jgi:hypothetical protein
MLSFSTTVNFQINIRKIIYLCITLVVGTGGWGPGECVVVVGFSVVVVVVLVVVVLGVVEVVVVVLGVVELVVVVLGVVVLVVVLGVVVVVVVVEVVVLGAGVVGMIIGAGDPEVPSIATAITPINAKTPKTMEATIQGRLRICSHTPAPLKLPISRK